MAETESPSIGIIVLAAGASSRMKQPKQLLKFAGKSLLRRAVEIAVNSVYEPVAVVLGANFELLQNEIKDLPVQVFYNENFQNGIGASIKTGLSGLLKIKPNLSAAVIMLSDQPFITARKINEFAERSKKSRAKIIAAEYDKDVGVPALFAKELFAELLKLDGDRGAKFIIKNYSDSLEKIALPEAAFDVDTPDDYEKLKELEQMRR